MQKVKMMIGDKLALVDEDQVKKHVNKQMYVARASELQTKANAETDPVCKHLLEEALKDMVSRIIRLNRTIRQNVQFIKV
jgi:hypothetical protein